MVFGRDHIIAGTEPTPARKGTVPACVVLCRLLPCALLASAGSAPAPARADLTAFIGSQSNPTTRMTRGISGGSGFLIVAFEGE